MLIDENAMVRMKSIGNYDQLVDYFSWICKVLGFTDPPKLPHKNLNLSFRNDYVDHISDTVVSLIRDYWHNDFFLFDKIIESGSTNYQERFIIQKIFSAFSLLLATKMNPRA